MIEQICIGFEDGCKCIDCCTREIANFSRDLGVAMLVILAACCIVGFVFRKTKWMKKFMKWAF